MKINLFVLSLVFLVCFKTNAQNKIIIQNNTGTFLNQSVQFNPSQDKFYISLECKVNPKYSISELQIIKNKLSSDFSGAKIIQSTTDNKIIFITNKTAVGANQGIEEYLKGVLVGVNLYRGFEENSVGTIELK